MQKMTVLEANLVPSKCMPVWPTAQMSLAEEAETECKSFWKGLGCPLGVGTTLKIEDAEAFAKICARVTEY